MRDGITELRNYGGTKNGSDETFKKWTGLGVRLAHCKGLGIKMWKLFRGMGNYM